MTNENLKQITNDLNNSTSDDIVSVGYGFKTVNGKVTNEKSVIFTVKEKKPLDQIPESDRLPSEIDVAGTPVKTDVVQGIVKLRAYGYCDSSFYTWTGTTPTNRDSFRPLKGGISVTNYSALSGYVGTLGFIAVDNDTNSLVGVTNSHVFCDDPFYTSERNTSGLITDLYTPTGHSVTQPNESINNGFSNKIGILKKYQPLTGTTGTNTVDVSTVAIDSLTLIDVNESWKQEGITGLTSAPRFATTSEIDTLLGNSSTEFYTAGRTTGGKGEGDTKLLNYSYPSSILINYPKQGVDTPVYMNDTFELVASGSTTPAGDYCYFPSAGGDSGSAILSKVGADWVIVGILYGGRYTEDPANPGEYLAIQTLCNRIDNVATALNISAWDGTLTGVTVSNTTAPEEHVVQGVSTSPSVTISGKTYWQVGMVNNSSYPPS